MHLIPAIRWTCDHGLIQVTDWLGSVALQWLLEPAEPGLGVAAAQQASSRVELSPGGRQLNGGAALSALLWASERTGAAALGKLFNGLCGMREDDSAGAAGPPAAAHVAQGMGAQGTAEAGRQRLWALLGGLVRDVADLLGSTARLQRLQRLSEQQLAERGGEEAQHSDRGDEDAWFDARAVAAAAEASGPPRQASPAALAGLGDAAAADQAAWAEACALAERCPCTGLLDALVCQARVRAPRRRAHGWSLPRHLATHRAGGAGCSVKPR